MRKIYVTFFLCALACLGANAQVTLLSQGFENAGVIPTGWANVQGGTGNLWSFSAFYGSSRTGSYCAEYKYNSSNAAKAYLISPAVSLTAGVTYTISYYEKTGSFQERLQVTVGNAQTVAAQTTILKATTNYTNTSYSLVSFTYTPASSGTVYFSWNCLSLANEYYLDLDDILITYPATPTVSSFTPTSGCAGTQTVTITGTNFTGATAVSFGGTAALSFSVTNSTTISATVGAGTTGTISVTGPGGTGTSAGTFTVNAAPAAIGGGAASVCTGATTAAFTDATAGGSWSITNGTGTASINSSGVVTGGTVGTVTVVYSVSGCTATKSLTVITTPAITTNPPNTSVIAGGNTTIAAAASNIPTSYTWEVNNGSGWSTITNTGVYSTSTTATLTITGATYSMNGYQYRVTATNACGSSTVSSSATLTVTYCTPSSTSGTAYITNFTTTGGTTNINNSSGYTAGGYKDYSATISATQTAGGTLNFSMTISGISGGAGVAVWVDYNNNGVFTDPGENVYSSGGYLYANPSGSFVIPVATTVGTHRMRIMTDYWSGTPTPCSFNATGPNGEVEDYNLVVTAAQPLAIGTITATQQTANVIIGSTNNNIILLTIPATGSIGTQTLTSVKVSSENISDADISSSGVKLWTGTATGPVTQIGSSQTFSGGYVTFSGLSTSITAGSTYLWITYDISSGATIGNTVDAFVASGDIAITAAGGATTQSTSPLLDPTGNRTIVGPLCGGYTINNTLPTAGTNYNSFTDAINDLNLRGISCNTVFSVKDGQTFNENLPEITATGTVTKSITFQRDNSTGTRPILQGTNGTGTGDAILVIYQTDYLTWDGIDLKDNASNSTGTTQMEYGIVVIGSATNGCNNNTFKNSSISLKTITSDLELTYGILENSVATSAAGANNNNKFYNLQISNCTYGIEFYNSVGSYYDNGNEINTISGGTSSISNVGSTSNFFDEYAIDYNYQTGFIVKNTSISTVTNYSGGYVYGIYATDGSSNTVDIENNTITGLSAAGNPYLIGISIDYGASAIVSNNIIKSISGASFETFGIEHTAGTIQANGNTIGASGATMTSTKGNGYVVGIYSVTSSSTNEIKNNIISYLTSTGANATQLIGINSGGPATTISGNTLSNMSAAGNATYTHYGIYSSAAGSAISSNMISSFAGSSVSMINAIYSSGASNTVSSNTITGITNSSTGNALGIYHTGSGSTATSNTIYTISAVSGNGYGIYLNSTGEKANSNIISAISSSTGYGIGLYGSTTASGLELTGNTVRNIAVTGASSSTVAEGIILYSAGVNTVQKNSVDSVGSSAVTNALAVGIRLDGGMSGTFNVTNNMVSKMIANSSNSATYGARGFSAETGAVVRLFNNSVYLAGTATNASFSSAALYTTLTTSGSLDMRNNIFYNNYSGTGKHSAVYSSSTSANYFTSLASTSNNNLLYAGTSGTSNVILRNTTADVLTVSSYVTAAGGTKESNSVTATGNPYINTSSFPSNLHINTASTNLCPVASGVTITTPVAVTDDIDGDIRQSPPDKGADEFTLTSPAGGTITASINPVCSGTAITISGASLSSGNDFSYQWKLSTDNGGTFNNITNTGVYTGATTATLSISNTAGLNGYQYELVTSRCSPALLTANSNVVTLVVNQPSTAPTSANATAVLTCGGATTLTQTGGVLGTGAYFQWYSDASFSTAVGAPTTDPNATTTTLVTNTTTFYVRIEGGTAPCASTTAAASVTVTPPAMWLGLTSSDWFDPLNWCGGVPTASSDVTIPLIVPIVMHAPVIPSGNAMAHNITILLGGSVTVSGTGIFSLYGAISNSGTLDITDGTLDLAANGVSVSGNSLVSSSVKNLKISGNTSLSATANDILKVTNELFFGNVNNKTFTTNDNLVMVSGASGTSSVDDITNNGANSGNSISGMASVERYIQAGRKWRFLAVNTAGGTLTVQNSWMESQAPGANAGPAGYGMWVTGIAPATGFDAASPGATIKWWDNSTNTYIPITDPTAYDIRSHSAYMTFVRGDRSATGSGAGASVLTSTVLRTKGDLVQGTTAPVSVTSGIKYTPIGNPYASAIDLTKLSYSTSGVINIAVWDPQLGSYYTLGAFQTLTSNGPGQPFTISPGGGSYSSVPFAQVNSIESGQGFLMQGTGTVRTLSFVETAKTTGNTNYPFFNPGQEQRLQAQFGIKAANGTVSLLDGAQVRFNTTFNTAADPDDARKMINTSENISVKRGSELMSVEFRNLPDENDTVQLNMTGLRAATYQWKLNLSNMDQPGRTAFLVDRYLNTETALNLTGSTTYDFPVVNIAGSYAVDRFLVVFRPAAVVPVTLTSISAIRLADKTVIVKWHSENEIGINHYELQRSGNGTQFISIASDQSPTNNAGGSASYSKIDLAPLNGDNYYRIKAISNNGRVQYTAIVKVDPLVKEGSISIYPNPISDRVMNLKFAGETPGKYQLQLSDKAGRIVYTSTVTITDGNEVKSLNIGDGLRSGGYDLVIIGADGKKKVIAVVLE